MALRKQGICEECGKVLYGDEYGAAGHRCQPVVGEERQLKWVKYEKEDETTWPGKDVNVLYLFPEGEVTVCNHDGEGRDPWNYSYHCGCCCTLLVDEPTHWMPIPELSKDE
jgi:hypothetical protein